MKLTELVGSLEADRFEVADAVYWFCVVWHNGQSSTLYRVQCELDYRPAMMASGPQSEAALEIYRRLSRTAKVDYARAERIAQRALVMVREVAE